jgi:hypothetical protein
MDDLIRRKEVINLLCNLHIDNIAVNGKRVTDYIRELPVYCDCCYTAVIEQLENELKLADEEKDRAARENPLQFDRTLGYANGIYNALEVMKEGLLNG